MCATCSVHLNPPDQSTPLLLRTNDEAPIYVTFALPLSIPVFHVPTNTSALRSETPTRYILINIQYSFPLPRNLQRKEKFLHVDGLTCERIWNQTLLVFNL